MVRNDPGAGKVMVQPCPPAHLLRRDSARAPPRPHLLRRRRAQTRLWNRLHRARSLATAAAASTTNRGARTTRMSRRGIRCRSLRAPKPSAPVTVAPATARRNKPFGCSCSTTRNVNAGALPGSNKGAGAGSPPGGASSAIESAARRERGRCAGRARVRCANWQSGGERRGRRAGCAFSAGGKTLRVRSSAVDAATKEGR